MTRASVKIARLYLLSDLLYNSAAPVRKASSYRTLLQKGLPEVGGVEGVAFVFWGGSLIDACGAGGGFWLFIHLFIFFARSFCLSLVRSTIHLSIVSLLSVSLEPASWSRWGTRLLCFSLFRWQTVEHQATVSIDTSLLAHCHRSSPHPLLDFRRAERGVSTRGRPDDGEAGGRQDPGGAGGVGL